MIAPDVLGVKIISRLDSMSTGMIWGETKLELNRKSPNQVIVDASEIENCDGSGTGCFVSWLAPGLTTHTY